MSRYRPTLLRRSDSISSRWVEEQAKLHEAAVDVRPGIIILPTSQSATQTAAQIANLKSKYPDLTTEELTDLINQFHAIPSSKDGSISQSTAISVVQKKENASYNRARETMKAIRADATHKLELEDWVEFVTRLRADNVPAMEPGKRDGTFKMPGAEGGISHSIDDDERVEFTEYINTALACDPDVSSRLPIPTDTMQIFDECRDGIIICKLIDHLFPGTVDSVMGIRRRRGTTYINLPVGNHHLNRFQIAENNNIAILAAQAIGVNVVNISGQDIAEGREHLILSLIGQIIRQGTSDAPQPPPKDTVRSSTPTELRRSSTPLERRASTPMKTIGIPASFPRATRSRSMSVDTDDITRVPSPVRIHRKGSDDRVSSTQLRNKLQERGTFKLFEDVKSGIIILETLDKMSPTQPTTPATPQNLKRSSTPTTRRPFIPITQQPPSPPTRRSSSPIAPRHVTSSRPSTPTTRKYEDAPKVTVPRPITRNIVTKATPVEIPKPNDIEIDEGMLAKHRALLHSLKSRI